MLNIQQIEALRKANPQLYEALKRLAGASLGPNQGWSIDNQITDGTNFARVSASALTANQIDPTKSGVLMRGSVPPTWSGAFTYVSTTSSLTWSWSGLAIYRADGSTTAIPNGSVAVTGLTAATTYYFYPYWDEVAGALAWVLGGAGTPACAQSAKTNLAAQQQALQGRIPLSQGAIAAATTSSGTGGGSGGGSGSCLRAGTVVLTKERGTVPIETCKVGEHLRCPSAGYPSRRRGVVGAQHAVPGKRPCLGAGQQSLSSGETIVGARYIVPGTDSWRDAADAESNEGWTRIVRLEIRDADTFIRLHFSNAESLDVTPHHIFTLADGSPMRAERLCLSDILVGRFARLTLKKIEVISEISEKVTVRCEPSLQFFAGRHSASVLTHNYTFTS
ncbi:MAG TPA: Hint domain-containing protein [Candidatus Acidoferrum sp.]|nr:Hint domain-containing protein [Candidatus Acidoferrum sp.]